MTMFTTRRTMQMFGAKLSGVAVLILAAAFGLASPASAQSSGSLLGACARFDLLGNGMRLEYQPFDPGYATDLFDLRIERMADAVARVRFVIVDTSPRTNAPGIGDAGPAFYDIAWQEDQARTVFMVGAGGPDPANGAEVPLPGRQGVAITRLRVTVPPGQNAPAAQHVERLVIRYQCLDAAGNPLGGINEQAAPITLFLRVPHYAAIFAGSAGQVRGAISFGTLSAMDSDLTRSIPIITLATSPYDVAISSENGGRLMRARGDGAGGGAANAPGIDYSMRFAGQDVADGTRLLCPATPAPSGNHDLLEVTLDPADIAHVPAGRYADVVTLTVTPRDTLSVGGCHPVR
jgi:hypothetical protein